MFSSKVLVEHVLQAAQKGSQGPGKATWSSVVKHTALQLSLLFDGNRREWRAPSPEGLGPLLGKARGRGCERQQQIWFRFS